MAQFELSGQVIHVDGGMPGPVVRSRVHTILRFAGLIVFIPVLIAMVAFVRLSNALVSGVLGHKRFPKRSGVLGDFVGDLVAHLAATRLASSGQTPVANARIRDSAGRVYPVRIEGHWLSGAITHGDSVTLRLRIVDRINIVMGGMNHTTHEPISVRR